MSAAEQKAPLELLPFDALTEVALVMGHAAESGQHGLRAWEDGRSWSQEFGASLRHLWKWYGGEQNDPQSGRSHLAHAAARVLFLLAYVQRRQCKHDDRPASARLFLEAPRERLGMAELHDLERQMQAVAESETKKLESEVSRAMRGELAEPEGRALRVVQPDEWEPRVGELVAITSDPAKGVDSLVGRQGVVLYINRDNHATPFAGIEIGGEEYRFAFHRLAPVPTRPES